ncbi:MAG: hypothetical protein KDC91_09165 [Flavobacteriaceae bacterium]|nr:hypothetical protein [Flavobacteriaceae bacterium]
MGSVKESLVPFVGTIGGLNFYFLDGKYTVRKAGGGFSARVHKKSPRIQENKSEFALAATPNRHLRRALHPLIQSFKIPYLHSRLQGALFCFRAFTPGKRGERDVYNSIVTAQGLQALQAFNYSPLCAMETALPYYVTYDEKTHVLQLNELDATSLKTPTEATHLKMRMTVVCPDAENKQMGSYPSEDVTLDLKALPEELVLTPEKVPPPKGPFLVYLRVWFYSEDNGRMVGLKTKEALGVWCVGYGGNS